MLTKPQVFFNEISPLVNYLFVQSSNINIIKSMHAYEIEMR